MISLREWLSGRKHRDENRHDGRQQLGEDERSREREVQLRRRVEALENLADSLRFDGEDETKWE